MDKQQQVKIGSREIIAIVIAMLVTKGTDTTPTIMFKAGYNAGWVIPILSALIMVGPLFITVSLVSKYKNKGLIEIIYQLTGKYIGFIIGLILFYVLFSSLVYNTRSYIDIMSIMFYPKTPRPIMYAILIIAVCAMAYLGLAAIGRSSWINFVTIQTVFIALIVLAQKGVTFSFIYPLLGSGIPKLIKSSLSAGTIWADIFYMAVVFPMVYDKKKFKKTIMFSFGLSVVEVTAMMFIFIITFGYPSIVYLNYPFQELTRAARFGSYFTHPEAFYLGFWSIAATIRYAAYLYLIAVTLRDILRIKDFKPLILTLSALTLGLGMLPENFTYNIFVIREQLLRWAWVVFVTLPVLLWIISKVKGDYAK
jgi:spore germination protein (amino acid permease)